MPTYAASSSGGSSSGKATSALAVIERQELGAAAANVDFTSIPADYDTLKLVVSARGDTAATQIGVAVQFNGDTAANYNWQRARTDNSSESYSAAVGEADADVGAIAAANAPANHAGMLELVIPHYAESTFYQYMFSQSVDSFGTALGDLEAWDHWSSWLQAAAINRVNVFPSSGNFVAGSVFTLYGLKGA